jgi:Phage-related terminase
MREKKTVPEQVDDVRMMYYQFRLVAIGVEKNGIGLASLQYLQVAELPISEFQDDADKYSRAVSIAARYKAGTVYHRSGASYLDEYKSELLTFPKGKYDDLVDMASYIAW